MWRLTRGFPLLVCLLASLWSWSVAAGGLNARPSGDAAAAFLRDAIPYWAAAETRMGQMSGSYVEELTLRPRATVAGGQKPPATTDSRRVRYAFDAHDGAASCLIASATGQSDQYVFATNKENEFNVHARSGGTFSIDSFRLAPDKRGDLFGNLGAHEMLYRVLAAESFDGFRLADVAAGTNGVRITQVRYVQGPQGPRAELQWDYPPRTDEQTPHVTAILNPANHWAVESWRRTYARGTIACDVTLRALADGTPFVDTLTWNSLGLHGEQGTRSVCRFEVPAIEDWTPATSDKFKLAAYGLRVPGQVTGGSKFVLLNVVGLLVLGGVFAVLARRRRGARPEDGQ